MAARRAMHPLEQAARASIDRRAVLRMLGGAGVLTAVGGAGSFLTACSSSSSNGVAGSGPGTTAAVLGAEGTVPAASVARYDPSRPYWLQGNFAPVADEHTVEAAALEVQGSLPPELDGLFVRNGSNPANGRSPHWFLGDGMVHGVRLGGGTATWYRNRYVQTPFYRDHRSFSDPGSGAPGGAASQSNVSVFHHAGALLTSGEVGLPYRLRTDDLSTIGVHDFAGKLTTSMTAHPKIDPATGEMHFFGYGFVEPYLTYHVAAADGTLRLSQPVDVPAPLMIHDFAITERDAVFWALPVVFDMQLAIRMIQGDDVFPFVWKPEVGSRVGVLPLGGPTSAVRWFDVDPCYVFHGCNAHRDGDKVVMDVCRLPSVFKDGGDLEPSALHRWTADLAGAATRIVDERVSDEQMDLPAIDRRLVGRHHRYGYFAGFTNDGEYGFEFTGVNRVDHDTGTLDKWEPGPHYRAGEVVFVPRQGSSASGGTPRTDDGDGWLLTYAYDRTRDASDLVVLDAAALAKGPVARVRLPFRVPYGFHGWWVPAEVLGE